MKDDLGDRMKRYENVTRFTLTPRSYTIIRVDGKAFHSFTSRCEKPFDSDLMDAMGLVAVALMENLSGSLIAYQQSDEVSIILQDFRTHNTEPWMGGVVQKQASIAASLATATFNYHFEKTQGDLENIRHYEMMFSEGHWPLFDARSFIVPDISEAMNYLVWRQQDATRNSINMAASSVFSPKSLHGLSSSQRQEKLFQEKNINWNDYPTRAKRGMAVYRETFVGPVVYTDRRTNEEVTLPDREQTRIVTDLEIPIFTQERDWLRAILEV